MTKKEEAKVIMTLIKMRIVRAFVIGMAIGILWTILIFISYD